MLRYTTRTHTHTNTRERERDTITTDEILTHTRPNCKVEMPSVEVPLSTLLSVVAHLNAHLSEELPHINAFLSELSGLKAHLPDVPVPDAATPQQVGN